MTLVNRRWFAAVLAVGAAGGPRAWTGFAAARSDVVLVEPLILARFGELPPPPAFLRLARITLAPGAAVPRHRHPGPEVAIVEAGVVSVSADGALQVAPAGTPGPTGAGDQVLLGPGDRVAYPAGTAFSFANPGDQPATLLALVVLPAGPGRPAGAEVLGTPDAGDGVRSIPLGDAVAPGWPAAPVDLLVDRLTLPAGTAVPASLWPTMLSVEQGVLAFARRGGEYQRSLAGGPPQPRSADGATERLGEGDAVFFPGGFNALPRAAADGELVLLRTVVAPVGAAAPAVPATPAGTPTAGFAAGDLVALTEDGVRVRQAPSAAAPIVGTFPAGTTFAVDGAPRQAEGGVWYPVTAQDGDAAGFVSAAFLAAAE